MGLRTGVRPGSPPPAVSSGQPGQHLQTEHPAEQRGHQQEPVEGLHAGHGEPGGAERHGVGEEGRVSRFYLLCLL